MARKAPLIVPSAARAEHRHPPLSPGGGSLRAVPLNRKGSLDEPRQAEPGPARAARGAPTTPAIVAGAGR
jgi:hypothetical protein